MILSIHPENPEGRKISRVVEILKAGGIIIYPTDTVYGLGCDITNHKAYERICQIRGIKPDKANFSFICEDLSRLSDYTLPIPNETFRIMRSTLPGPYTYILKANKNVPKMFKNKKKTVGVRVQNNNITQAILAELGNPILSASLKNEDDFLEYHTDPWEIHEEYGHIVDVVIDGGPGTNEASTVIDFTEDIPVLIRQGAGEVPF